MRERGGGREGGKWEEEGTERGGGREGGKWEEEGMEGGGGRDGSGKREGGEGEEKGKEEEVHATCPQYRVSPPKGSTEHLLSEDVAPKYPNCV